MTRCSTTPGGRSCRRASASCSSSWARRCSGRRWRTRSTRACASATCRCAGSAFGRCRVRSHESAAARRLGHASLVRTGRSRRGPRRPRHRLLRRRGRAVRPRRRVRLRKDDRDPRAYGPPPPERERRGPGPARGRERPRPGGGQRCAAPLERDRDGLSGRHERLQPRPDDRRADRRADGAPRCRGRARRRPPRAGTARGGRYPGGSRRPLPARVLGRHAPARGSHVRGRDRGARPGRRALPRPAPPVHAPPLRGDARPLRRRRGRFDPGRPAAPRPGADRLSLRATLRPRLRPVPDGDAAHARGRHPPLGRLSSERTGRRGRVVIAETSSSGTPLLEVEDLVVRYPVARGLVGTLQRRPKLQVHAVEGVSFTLRRGEMLALVGESGCGKTTTAQTVLRMLEPDRGTIRYRGQDISRLSSRRLRPLRRQIQIIYQDPYESLDPRFRVRATVEEPLVIHRLGSREERRKEVAEALRLAGLDPPDLYLERYPHELSGGQRQRVAIAASLVLHPDVLVADAPVSMLDVSVRAGVLGILSELRARGLGILMITHDLSTAARFADRIAVMYLGRIVEEGPAQHVVNNPQHPYTRALLSAVPKRDPRERTTPRSSAARRRTRSVFLTAAVSIRGVRG